jgi:hypothetical protein
VEAIDGETKPAGRLGPVTIIVVFAHVVFYFAHNLYLPFDLKDLFLLGYALVLADSAFLVMVGVKLWTLLWTRR